MDEKSAIAKLKGLKVKGELSHIRKEKGISDEMRKQSALNQQATVGQGAEGDIPF